MHYFYLTLLLVLFLNATYGTDASNLKEKFSEAENEDIPIQLKGWKFFQDDRGDVSKDENVEIHSPATPAPNSLKNRRLWQTKKKEKSSSSTSDEEEKEEFLDDWEGKRMQLKFEALNSTARGDVVNIKSVRPWGIRCGDPNQHDLPWGSCTLAAECDAEYRIYRGDSFCGRSVFVCCALERTSYDLYQALDMSFEHEDSLATDTEDEDNKNTNEVKQRARKLRKQRRKRIKRKRIQTKKKIKTSIKRIIREIKNIIQKAYRNGSSQKNLKSKQLKDFIKQMKLQYRKDRKSIVDAHEFNMEKYDMNFESSLNKIVGVNDNFLNNDTFRDIVVNGTVNREKLTNLQRTHPALSLFFSKHRRMGGGDLESESEKIKPETEEEDPKPEKDTPKHLEYDLEYGMLYF